MKKALALTMAAAMSLSLAACGGSSASSTAASTDASTGTDTTASSAGSTTITVVSSFGGEDGNRQNFLDYIAKYEDETGNKVKETGTTADETWKAQVQTDFQSNAEPDVLFYFIGVDSNPIVESGKVVPVDEIRAEYPEYAANMKDSLMGSSPVDGKTYAVPFVGYWESMYVNTKVLADAGVDVPTNDGYTWDQFMTDCQKVKDAGYTPIAMSLQQTPHYWFEYTVLNHDTPANHTTIPASVDDEAGKAWTAGMDDIKTLYENGFLPANTLTATDDETFQMMADDEAAFAIDGSWKYGWFVDNADLDNFVAICPPSQGDRGQNDIIGGISMGYYITRKAWDDPEKRDACVKFVETMTSDEATSAFANAGNVTALKNEVTPTGDTNPLLNSIFAMTASATSVTGATQDGLLGEQRDNLFSNIKNICTGEMTSADALQEMLDK